MRAYEIHIFFNVSVFTSSLKFYAHLSWAWKKFNNLRACNLTAHINDSEPPGHLPCLIRVLTWCMRNVCCPLSSKHILWSHWVYDQAYRIFCWVQSKCWFCDSGSDTEVVKTQRCVFIILHKKIYPFTPIAEYSKLCVNGHSKIIDKTKVLMTNSTLMKVEIIAECSPWSIL